MIKQRIFCSERETQPTMNAETSPTQPPARSVATTRLLLRPMDPTDAPALHALMDDPVAARFFPNPTPPPLERVEKWAARQAASWDERGYGLWAVCLRPGGQVVGWAGLQYLPDTDETEVAYQIDRSHWGQGLASEAARAALDYAFRTLGLAQIVAVVHPENAASIRVIEKAGMRFTGQCEYFGMQVRRYVALKDPG